MTFQAYLDNIEKATGVTPDQFIKLAKAKGLTKPGTKATEIVNWLKADYKLGHGHAMAIVKLLKDRAGQKSRRDSPSRRAAAFPSIRGAPVYGAFTAHPLACLGKIRSQGAGRLGGNKDKPVRNMLEEGSSEPFRAIVAEAADGVIGIDAAQRIVLFNRAAEQLFLYSAAEAIGQKLTMLMPMAHRGTHEHSVRAFARSEAPARYMGERHQSLKAQRSDGTEFSAAISIMQINMAEGLLMVAHVRDISERVELLERQVHLATRDHLTGALNRRAFLERAEIVHARWRDGDRGYAVMMLDLDHFKSVNDTHGHAVGDAVIESFSQLCQTTLRDGDIFARWGGEEFVALLPDANVASAIATAERIRLRTHRRTARLGEGVHLKQTVSIGIAAPAAPDSRLEDVIRRADQALYAAKSAGRNRVSAISIGGGGPQTRSA